MRTLLTVALVALLKAIIPCTHGLEASVNHSFLTNALKNAKSFDVDCRFDALEEPLKLLLKDELIRSLQEIGAIYSPNDELTKEQHEEKHKPWKPRMFICAFPKYELFNEGSDSIASRKKLPILEISIEIQRGIEDIDEEYIRGIVWHEERYIHTLRDEKEYYDIAVKNLKAALTTFKTDYQLVNPPGEEQKPRFFFLNH